MSRALLRQLLARARRSVAFAVACSSLASALALTLVSFAWGGTPADRRWSADERETLRSMSLAALAPLPADPSNRHADDPRAARLGRALFSDARLSGNGQVSCATCHLPERTFQDDRALARGVGMTARRTMPIAGTARSAWLFWDGRADSQWAQALGPLESAVEHGGTRTQYAHVVAAHYRPQYEALFGALPDLRGLPHQAGPVENAEWRAAWERLPVARRDSITRVFVNVGKAIGAFERGIDVAPSRFDRFVDAELAGRPHTSESELTADERAGLRVFIGKGSCINCHNGALLADDHFHNTGVGLPRVALPFDSGRATGARQAVAGEFNCLSRWSDAPPDACDELRFATTDGEELVRAYKTPSLRNVADRAPFMHAGQLATLDDVVAHYDRAPASPAGHSELKPLRLSRDERRQLAAFLRTLSGDVVVKR
jgi:cytochrome c peroxidase